MKTRQSYLSRLIAFRNKSPIKVITGVRRCGKSSLFDLFEDYLTSDGVPKDSIIRLNFESLEFDSIRDYKSLHDHITARQTREGTTYILLDEIQHVSQWERAINSLRLDRHNDIYITGSNAWLLSSELSTLLSGRYVEIKMLPLSFREFLDFNDYDKTNDISEYFSKFIQNGGFPGITELREQPSTIGPFLSGIYNTIIMKDVVQRGTVRDPALLESVVRFLASNIGNLISTKKISDYLTSSARKTTSETIDNYIDLLEKSFIIYRARRFDLKGKQHLKTNEKFYFIDTGIRNELIGHRNDDYGYVLENIVYFELLRRGFEVSVGKIDALEVDFVATKPDKVMYIQVTASMLSEETKERELKPLQKIQDYHERLILTMDRTPTTDHNGIRIIYIPDFLLSVDAYE